MPSSPNRIPPKTPAAATIEPTDRSMPPVAITNVMPIASTPTTLAWRQHVADVVPGRERVGLEDRADDEQQRRRRPRARTPAARSGARQRAGAAGGGSGTVVMRSPPRTGASVGATAWRSSSSSVALVAVDLGDDLALAHDEDARAEPDQLLELGGDDEHARARPSRGRRSAGRSRPWSPTSTPRVGSSSSSTRHSRSSQRASTTFCWLPPESSARDRGRGRRARC